MSFLYREAGRVLQGVEDGKASLKTLTLGRANTVGGGKGGDENGPKRKLYAMVSETLRYKPLLDRLVMKADPKGTLFAEEHMRDKAQGYIMLYEMLLGKGSIQGGGKVKRHLMQYKDRLQECLAEAKVSAGLPADASNETLLPKSARRHIFPRYARVNLTSCPEGAKGVAATLQKEGFAAKIDGVVPSLLVLPAGTDLHDHAMVKDGRLVLQDKSSCFSAEALLGEEASTSATASAAKGGGGATDWRGGDVIDACAAPGNKTMHAASLLFRSNPSKRAKVFAFDKDLRRLALMRRRVDDAGASAGGAVETRLQDFLEVDPAEKRYAKVTAILLDPSCSGSGIVSAPDRLHENQGEAEEEGGAGGDGTTRVERLAAFQLQVLLKAMSFPQVQRVCYSTCSVHVEENEDVVAKALEHQRHQPAPASPPHTNTTTTTTTTTTTPRTQVSGTAAAPAPSNRFGLSRCLSRWSRRGKAVSGLSKAQAACLVRTDPFEDDTNGFFVAVFQRGGEDGSSSSTNSASSDGAGTSRNGNVDSSGSGNGVGGEGGGGGGVGGEGEEMGGDEVVAEGGAATKKKRNRHKNRKKNKKKRKREGVAAEAGAGDGQGGGEGPATAGGGEGGAAET